MAISSFPASVGFDPTKYLQLNTFFNNYTGFTSVTPIEITGTKGFIESFDVYNVFDSIIGSGGIKITVDGKVYADISVTGSTGSNHIRIGSSSKISGSDSLKGYTEGSTSTWVLGIQFNEGYGPLTLSESNQNFVDTTKVFNLTGQIIKFNDSFKIELTRGTADVFSPSQVRLTYFTRYI